MFGVIMILVIFGLLLYRLLFIAQNAPDVYGYMIVTGIFAHIALQVILNVAVVTNVIPNTGNYITVYQLWRYVGSLPDGRNGNSSWSIKKKLKYKYFFSFYNKCAILLM